MEAKTTASDKKTISKMTTSEDDPKTSICKLLLKGDMEEVKKLIDSKIDLNVFEQVDELAFIDENVSPLIFCAYYGKMDLTKQLMLNKMIDVDLHSPLNRQTPLIAACMGGNYEMAKYLLDNHAEVNKPNAFNQTPIIAIFNRLIEESGGFQNRCICFKIADLLVARGADLNWVLDKQKGHTLLHTLCASTLKMNKMEKQLIYDIVKFLIDKGANINQRTLNDKTAEDLAASHCNSVAIIDLITKKKEMQEIRPRTNSQSSLRGRELSTLRDQYMEDKGDTKLFEDSEPVGRQRIPSRKAFFGKEESSIWADKLSCIKKKK